MADRTSEGKFKPGTTVGRFQKGVSGNPSGNPSIVNDLKRLGAETPGMPGTTAEARQRWWAALLPIAFAGPQGANDGNWKYAHQQTGDRLLGKVKEHVEITEGKKPASIDYGKLSVVQLEALAAIEVTDTEDDGEPGSTEH